MRKVVIAFDVDGTLRDNTVDQNKPPVANEDIRQLLILLSRFKNVYIVVWSGGGEIYARQVVKDLGLSSYVDYYADKHYSKTEDGLHEFHPDIEADIAIDDIQDCVLGKINLIVREE